MIGEIDEINTLQFVMQSKNNDVTIYKLLIFVIEKLTAKSLAFSSCPFEFTIIVKSNSNQLYGTIYSIPCAAFV